MPKWFLNILLLGWLLWVPALLAAQTETLPKTPAGEDPPPVDISQMTDIHDIKPLAALSWYQRQWFVAATVALAVLLLAGILYYWQKRRRRPNPEVNLIKPPDQIAQELLKEIVEVQHMDGKTFYFQLSAILRDYIQGRFGLNAPDLTTEELLPRLTQLPLDGGLADDLRTLFQSSEPIKYANGAAFAHQMQQDWLFAQRFVAETTLMDLNKEENDSQ
jgi:hypothetical protein